MLGAIFLQNLHQQEGECNVFSAFLHHFNIGALCMTEVWKKHVSLLKESELQ
jgi:hypothetical protein